MINSRKGFIQISFPWLFAIIVGIFIIFLAIYGVTKLIKTEQTVQDIKTSKEIGILLNPLETGFEDVKKPTPLGFPVDTRMYNDCTIDGQFGKQIIRVSQKSFNQWTDTDIDIGFSNKYFFSKDIVEGKEMFVFSKPFKFPFKVTDLLYLISSNEVYCFINPPNDIEEELEDIGSENLLSENCSNIKNVTKVCFTGGSNCDVNVNTVSQSIEKREGKVYYEGDALMYAGIFSEPEIYECQLQRIMKRLKILTELYNNKAVLIIASNCNTNLEGDLLQLNSLADSFQDSVDLFKMTDTVNEIERKNNDNSRCKLW